MSNKIIDWSESVSIHPWVGEDYECPKIFPCRTLILGESHYTENPKYKDEKNLTKLTIGCVQGHIKGVPDRNFNKFGNKIRKAVFPKDPSNPKKGSSVCVEPFWKECIFYNYVQRLVSTKARIKPTDKMWKESQPAFCEIIERLKPQRVLVLGKRLWGNLREIVGSSNDQELTEFKVGDHKILLGYIYHPSSAFKYAVWSPKARKILGIGQ